MVAIGTIVRIMVMLFVIMAVSIVFASVVGKGRGILGGEFTSITDQIDTITCQFGFCFGQPRLLNTVVLGNSGGELQIEFIIKSKDGYIVINKLDGKEIDEQSLGGNSGSTDTNSKTSEFNDIFNIPMLSSSQLISSHYVEVEYRKATQSSYSTPLVSKSVVIINSNKVGTDALTGQIQQYLESLAASSNPGNQVCQTNVEKGDGYSTYLNNIFSIENQVIQSCKVNVPNEAFQNLKYKSIKEYTSGLISDASTKYMDNKCYCTNPLPESPNCKNLAPNAAAQIWGSVYQNLIFNSQYGSDCGLLSGQAEPQDIGSGVSVYIG